MIKQQLTPDRPSGALPSFNSLVTLAKLPGHSKQHFPPVSDRDNDILKGCYDDLATQFDFPNLSHSHITGSVRVILRKV